MVDLSFLKRRRAKRIVALVGLIGLAGVVVIGAAALLGTNAAPLTVKVNNSGSKLTLKTSNTEGSESYSYLVAKDVPGYTEYTEGRFQYVQGQIDSEVSEPKLTSDNAATEYFKYTFYIENIGDSASYFKLNLNISNPNRSSAKFDLADVLRVRMYENYDLEEHNFRTFAKRTSVYNEETGDYDYGPERISTKDSDYAEMFESNKVVLSTENKSFEPGAIVRYTFVMWIEGEDHDSDFQEAPVGTTLSLGIDISAHEAEAEDAQQEEIQQD